MLFAFLPKTGHVKSEFATPDETRKSPISIFFGFVRNWVLKNHKGPSPFRIFGIARFFKMNIFRLKFLSGPARYIRILSLKTGVFPSDFFSTLLPSNPQLFCKHRGLIRVFGTMPFFWKQKRDLFKKIGFFVDSSWRKVVCLWHADKELHSVSLKCTFLGVGVLSFLCVYISFHGIANALTKQLS